ncbi:hypothetical protein BCY86_03360 [Pajaroellobacter abortibovis]|uniref:Uncharacterized protein n=1 Tax=Pajaroellobacter abortibovis TaxID=1882918 RepID=A0A1L6MWC4_9BACT|nr:hypothetical protein BCY86_03360 [Pajaroellobacter abortibovis]
MPSFSTLQHLVPSAGGCSAWRIEDTSMQHRWRESPCLFQEKVNIEEHFLLVFENIPLVRTEG